MTTRRDLITDGGIAVVGLAAAILTFTTLTALGVRVGFTGQVLGFRLAWLLPVVVDAAAIVAARVWLRAQGTDEAISYGRKLALACIALSVVFNGGLHLLDAAGWTTAPWWVVLPVTSVPPAVLAAVVHLGHLLHRTPRPDAPSEPVRTPPVQATAEVVRTPPSDDRPTTPDVPAITAADVPRTTPELAPDQPSDDPDPLLDQVVRWASERDGRPSPTAVRTEFKVGRDRAVRLLDQLARTPRPNAPSEE